MSTSPPQRVLLTSVGTSEYKRAVYRHRDGRETETPYAALASAAFARPDRIVVLATKKAAKKHCTGLVEEARRLGLPEPCWRPIPAGRTQEELLKTFRRVQAQLPTGALVHLEITLALRHLPFLLFAAVTSLRATRELELVDITYGAFEARDAHGRVPVLSLAWASELVDWYAAARVLEAGDAAPLARLLTDLQRQAAQSGERPALKRVGTWLDGLSAQLRAGLPLDLAVHAARELDREAVQADVDRLAPAAGELVARALDRLASLSGSPKFRGKPGKDTLVLDIDLCRQQLAVARALVQQQDAAAATRVARELVVDRVLLAQGEPAAVDWLTRPPREQTERDHVRRILADRNHRLQPALTSLWQHRNALAHAGHCPQDVDARRRLRTLDELLDQIADAMADDAAWRPGLLGSRTLWVSPVGLSRGLVYTLLAGADAPPVPAPYRLGTTGELLLVTSEAARPGAEEALARAGWGAAPAAERVRWVVIEDPFCGFTETEAAEVALRELLPRHDRVVFNMTGGTTVLQFLIDRLRRSVERSRDRVTPVATVACVDRRPYPAQQAEPYEVGELLWLEASGYDELAATGDDED